MEFFPVCKRVETRKLLFPLKTGRGACARDVAPCGPCRCIARGSLEGELGVGWVWNRVAQRLRESVRVALAGTR